MYFVHLSWQCFVLSIFGGGKASLSSSKLSINIPGTNPFSGLVTHSSLMMSPVAVVILIQFVALTSAKFAT